MMDLHNYKKKKMEEFKMEKINDKRIVDGEIYYLISYENLDFQSVWLTESECPKELIDSFIEKLENEKKLENENYINFPNDIESNSETSYENNNKKIKRDENDT